MFAGLCGVLSGGGAPDMEPGEEIGSHSCGVLQCLLVTLSWSWMDETKLQTISSPLLDILIVAANSKHLQWHFMERNVVHNAAPKPKQ